MGYWNTNTKVSSERKTLHFTGIAIYLSLFEGNSVSPRLAWQNLGVSMKWYNIGYDHHESIQPVLRLLYVYDLQLIGRTEKGF